jgi:hypothetical protein
MAQTSKKSPPGTQKCTGKSDPATPQAYAHSLKLPSGASSENWHAKTPEYTTTTNALQQRHRPRNLDARNGPYRWIYQAAVSPAL